MHSRTLATALGALCLVACAHSSEQIHTSTSSHEVAPPIDTPPEREVIAVDRQAAEVEPAKARPRLSQTVTLGAQNNDAQYVGPAAPPPQAGAAGGTNVTINNNVIVNGQPTYGYGGYGYGYRGYGYSNGVVRDGMSRPNVTPQWGSSGWEGARRTAAPGQTPGVGGNWSPAPSYGPAPMR